MSGREQRYCEQCGQRLPPGARRCDRCGAVQSARGEQSPQRRDRSPDGSEGRSGQRNPDGSRRGRPSNHQGESSNRQGRPRGAQEPPRRRDREQGGRRGRSSSGDNDSSTLLVVVGGLVVVGVLLLFVAPILGAFVLGLGDSVEESPRPADAEPAAEDFLVALAEGDRQTVQQHSVNGGPVAEQLDGAADGPAAALADSGFTVVDLRLRTQGTETAVVDATLEPSGTESTTEVTLELRTEDGEWLVWDLTYPGTSA